VKLVVNKYVIWLSSVGHGRNVLQNEILLHSQEASIIHLETPNVNKPFGLNHRFAYYCSRNFFIQVD
jgi:hypothetical protein